MILYLPFLKCISHFTSSLVRSFVHHDSENLDDPANWNPLKKGSIKFLTEVKCGLCATVDIGKAAAVMFQNQDEWNGKTLDVISWRVRKNYLHYSL